VKGGGAVFNSGIYQNWQEEQRASARSVEGMRPVPMVRTDEPVSPEAEAAEAVALRSLGLFGTEGMRCACVEKQDNEG